jgi:hypothetical protein
MVTSKSAKTMQKCVGGVLLFSGRPNPTWQVSADTVAKLMTIWNVLTPAENEKLSTPKLGYQGCFLKCPNNEEWTAFEGIVMRRKLDAFEYRRDKERTFEKTLLSSAPKGILPPSFPKQNRLL